MLADLNPGFIRFPGGCYLGAAVPATTLWPRFVAAAVKILLPATGMAD
jgi:hypothetical protein